MLRDLNNILNMDLTDGLYQFIDERNKILHIVKFFTYNYETDHVLFT
jgi:hypothetical protein